MTTRKRSDYPVTHSHDLCRISSRQCCGESGWLGAAVVREASLSGGWGARRGLPCRAVCRRGLAAVPELLTSAILPLAARPRDGPRRCRAAGEAGQHPPQKTLHLMENWVLQAVVVLGDRSLQWRPREGLGDSRRCSGSHYRGGVTMGQPCGHVDGGPPVALRG